MKKSVIFILLLVYNLSVNAQTELSKQIENARFQIIKASVEFLASDKAIFPKAQGKTCSTCKDYNELISFISQNQILKADKLVKKWQGIPLDTSLTKRKDYLVKFKGTVVDDIASGSKSGRKKFENYNSYLASLDSIIKGVVIPQPVPAISNVSEGSDSSETSSNAEQNNQVMESESKQESLFSFLPMISQDMSYIIIFLLLAGIGFLLWLSSNKNKALQKKVRSLENQLVKVSGNEWQSKNVNNELKNVSQKLKEAEKEIAVLKENLKAETERNQRLSAIPAIEKPVMETPVSSTAPVIKYARYADQGDGFSVQELLDEEDSETIFELSIKSSNSASFRISANQTAQKYALSNSPYFLGKTSQYDTFPSGNSLINTDVAGELKLQGNKWLIIKPAQISFT